jgi:hypothetical protein
LSLLTSSSNSENSPHSRPGKGSELFTAGTSLKLIYVRKEKSPERQHIPAVLILESVHLDGKIGATCPDDSCWGAVDRVEDSIIPGLPQIP